MNGGSRADRAKSLARIVPTYCFMYFLGPVLWHAWMALRLGLLTLEESCRCLLSPWAISIAAFLFILNVASLANGMERNGEGAGERAVKRRMAVHFASLFAFATIGTVASMSALHGADSGGIPPQLKLVIGSINGFSMCFVFYASSSANLIACILPPERGSGESRRRILAMARAYNSRLFAVGLPLFLATSLAGARLGGGIPTDRGMIRLLASIAVPVTMGSFLFIRADRGLAAVPVACSPPPGPHVWYQPSEWTESIQGPRTPVPRPRSPGSSFPDSRARSGRRSSPR